MKTLRTFFSLCLHRAAVAVCAGALLPLVALAQYTGGQGRGDVMVAFPPPALIVNSITVDFDPVGLCADGLNFSVPYTATGTYGPGNTFTLELSDAFGSFAAPLVVGTLVSDNTSGSITGAIPIGTPFGNQYRVRVVASTPATIGTPNATDIIMLQLVNWYADVDGDGLGDPNDFVLACVPPDPSYVNNDDDPCPLAVDAIPNSDPNTCGCDLGYFATITDIGGNDVITACTICPPGFYCPDGLTAFPCAAGAFSDVSGAIACTFCPAGSFSAATGSTVCTSCPAGSFSDATGSVSCTSCPAGSFSSTVGSTVCESCPAGSFSDVVGSVSCTSCPAGSFSATTGSTVCTSCPAGSFSDVVGSVSCTSCPAGSFSNTIGSTSCESCSAGTFSAVVGATECVPCAAGSFSSTTGATSCESCPSGTFSAVTGSVSCTPCAAGFANGNAGQTSCSACPPGSFSASAGQATCTLCPAGTYNPLAAQTECLACPNGQTSGEGAIACTPEQACTTDLDLIWQPDGVSDVSWEIREQGSNNLMQSGGGIYPPAEQYSEATCLPNGCFYLVVTDDLGDGIAGGGYLLKVNSAARLIDNLVDIYGNGGFTSGTTSAIDGNEGFCLPVGSDRLIYTSCDKMDWAPYSCGQAYIVANDNPAVSAQFNVNNANSGYQMWFYNPNGGYSFKRFQSHSTSNGLPASATRACHFALNAWVGNQLQQGVLYNVKVRGRVNGVYNPWGPACRMMLNNALAFCPRTKLMDIPSNPFLSCGQPRAIGTTHLVHARPVKRLIEPGPTCSTAFWQNANRYQFRFRLPDENITIIKTSAVGAGKYFVNTNGLACNKTYQVEVRASFDGGATWCHGDPNPNVTTTQWGDICLLTTTCSFGMAQEGGTATGAAAEAKVMMYPNPNRGDQLFLQLSALEAGVEQVTVDLFDGFGKRVATRTLGAKDGYVNTTMQLNELANGPYLVRISGSRTFNGRLVIQK